LIQPASVLRGIMHREPVPKASARPLAHGFKSWLSSSTRIVSRPA
jgi:hypothetical protein